MAVKKKPTWFTVEAELEYAKVFERNRDMGNDEVDHSETDGLYTVNLIIDEEAKQDMIRAGVPEKSGPGKGYEMFKPTDDGRWKYVAKRPHLSKYMTDENGEQVVVGPPRVRDANTIVEDEDGKKYYADWDTDVNIGNGSIAIVKGKVIHARRPIVQLEAIAVKELVEYEDNLIRL